MKTLALIIGLTLACLTTIAKEKEVTKVVSTNTKVDGKIVSATITYYYADKTFKTVKFK